MSAQPIPKYAEEAAVASIREVRTFANVRADTNYLPTAKSALIVGLDFVIINFLAEVVAVKLAYQD